jgi:hypothetical protein
MGSRSLNEGASFCRCLQIESLSATLFWTVYVKHGNTQCPDWLPDVDDATRRLDAKSRTTQRKTSATRAKQQRRETERTRTRGVPRPRQTRSRPRSRPRPRRRWRRRAWSPWTRADIDGHGAPISVCEWTPKQIQIKGKAKSRFKYKPIASPDTKLHGIDGSPGRINSHGSAKMTWPALTVSLLRQAA